MGLVRTLIDCDGERVEPALPQELRELYDGDLHFSASSAARPFVLANFVSTLDGVVSYEMNGNSGGSAISGSDPADRFIMGLLRASADAVIVGARTLQAVSSESLWTPESTYPDAKRFYAEYRVNALGQAGISPARCRERQRDDWSWRERFFIRRQCAP
ncbi:MAG: dihydrofolate reductase family protein [Terracidiphilus sp.]